jgi:replicative DNA helicase
MAKKSDNAEVTQPLPTNIEAEKSILGAILMDNRAILKVREMMAPEDFFLQQHVHILGHMIELADANTPIDLLTLSDKIGAAEELELVGGSPYLASLVDGMPRVSNVEHYVRIVKNKALLRTVIHAAHHMQQRAFENDDAGEVIASAMMSITNISHGAQRDKGPVPLKQIVQDTFPSLEKIYQEGRSVIGVSTGYSELDRLTSGLQPSELIILAARPSQGKTALALNLAENIAARRREPVLFFSLEMNRQSLLLRLLSSMARVDAHKFRTGHISKDDWGRLLQAMTEAAQAPIWVDDASNLNVSSLAARIAQLKQQHDLKLVIADYLQLFSGSRRFASRQEEVSEISRSLKAVAKEMELPLLVLSQLKRTTEKEGPQLSDLRESGAIEQDADVVIFIHRPKFSDMDLTPEERSAAEVIVAKQRNGPTDRVRFVFLSHLTRFEEAAPDLFGYQEGDPR